MKIYHSISLDLTQNDAGVHIPAIAATEGDCGTHVLKLQLLEGGKNWPIPADATALISYARADGTGGTYDTLPDGQPAWRIEEGVLLAELAPACFSVATLPWEEIRFTVTLLRGDSQLTTQRIPIVVQRLLVGDGQDSGVYVSFASLIRQYIGDPTKLNTENTGSIVDAINEALEKSANSGVTIVAIRVTEAHELEMTLSDGRTLNAGRVLVPGSVGGVSTVCGMGPDDDGDVPLTAGDVGAAPRSWAQQRLVRENLLDNWYFKNVINQRMADSYYQMGPAFDRWSISDEVTVSANFAGLDFYCQAPNAYMEQVVDMPRQLNSCTVTLSALLSENSGDFHLWLLKERGGNITQLCHGSTDEAGLLTVSCTLGRQELAANDRLLVRFGNGAVSSQSYMLDGVKLERGFFSTLACQENGGWMISCLPDYSQQLLRCQRFYQFFRTQSLRPSYAADFRPPLQAEPSFSTRTLGGVTYYVARAEL